MGMGNCVTTLENSLIASLKVKHINILGPAIHSWVAQEMKTYVHSETWMQVFIAALFIATKN